ncbi:immunoglobulin E-set [Chytriomyces cf. hyalinus JEL632]|nr:immunoglobulin E-set [Chytriomyces cf. hyalinus JEL632]
MATSPIFHAFDKHNGPKGIKDNSAVSFVWDSHQGNHKSVIVTGSFDNWSQSVTMVKDAANDARYLATVTLGPSFKKGDKITYKFIVDGEWRVSPSQPTEHDASGNENNVFIASSGAPQPPQTTASDNYMPAVATAAESDLVRTPQAAQPAQMPAMERELKTENTAAHAAQKRVVPPQPGCAAASTCAVSQKQVPPNLPPQAMPPVPENEAPGSNPASAAAAAAGSKKKNRNKKK